MRKRIAKKTRDTSCKSKWQQCESHPHWDEINWFRANFKGIMTLFSDHLLK